MARKTPHDGKATREALVQAAERLFAEQGVEAPSVRSINAAAGLAPAAVHYHFGSKEGLLDAVVHRQGDAVVARIVELAEELLAAESVPSPLQLVETLGRPYVELLEREPVRGARWLSIAAQLSLAHDKRFAPDESPATVPVQELVRRAFPDADASARERAWELAADTLMLMMSRWPAGAPGADDPSAASSQDTELLFAFIAGGLERALNRD